MARPTKYNPQYHLPWIKGLVRRGCTGDEISKELGVALSTFNKWLKEHEELAEAVRHGRSYSDAKVEASLYMRAKGFTKRVTKTVNDGKKSRTETIEEDVPPDTTACIFWLKNRAPNLWKDKQDVAISDSGWVKALEEVVDGK